MKNNLKPKSSDKEEPFVFSSGIQYADKDEFAEKALSFHIMEIDFQPGAGFDGQDRWAVRVHPEDRIEELITLPSNPKRDEQMRLAQAHIAAKDPIGPVRLKKSGNTFYFENVAKPIPT